VRRITNIAAFAGGGKHTDGRPGNSRTARSRTFRSKWRLDRGVGRFHFYAPFLSREACAAPAGGGGWAWWGWAALEYESVSRVCPLYTFRFHLS